ncbi:MAG: HEAT repeat domain-containing protein [Gemmataceae bacterium]|nr:HEAT repeat domain-containing protein [Gemmataceae bacterium]
MTLSMRCPGCGCNMSFKPEMRGMKGRCSSCKTPITLNPPTAGPPPISTASNPFLPPLPPQSSGDFALDDEKPRRSPRRSGNRVMIVVTCVALVALLGTAIGLGVWMANQPEPGKQAKKDEPKKDGKDKKKEEKDGAKKGEEPKIIEDKDGKGKDSKKDGKEKDGGKKEGKEPSEEEPRAGLPPEKVYKRLLRSTAWIVMSGSFGSGALIDRTERLVVTNYHVVEEEEGGLVFFPAFDKGGAAPINEPKHYLAARDKLGVRARVLARDPKRDLALLQLESLPAGACPVGLARHSPEIGSTLVSIGASGAGSKLDGVLWRNTRGEVRQVYRRKIPYEKQTVDALVVETASPTNQGDSGGPVADLRCRLAAVVTGGSRKERNVSWNIDVSEVRAFMNEHFRKEHGKDWEEPPAPPVADEDRLPKLLAMLDGDLKAQLKAIEELALFGPDAQRAVPRLIALFKTGDPSLGTPIVRALESIGPPDPAHAGLLADLLKTGRVEMRRYAILALEQLGARGHEAVPELVRACKDSSPEARVLALRALARVANHSQDGVLAAVLAALRDEKAVVRHAAAVSLRAFGKLVRAEAYPTLLKALGEDDPTVLDAILVAFSGLGDPEEGDLDALRKASAEKSPRVRSFVLACLARLGKRALPALPEIKERLADEDAATRRNAAAALGCIGPLAVSAAPALHKAFGDRDPDVRLACVGAVAAVGGHAGVHALLLDALADASEAVRQAAAAALDATAAPAGDDLKGIEARFHHDARDVRWFAAKAVRQMGRSASPSVAGLVRLATKDRSSFVRTEAALALAGLDPAEGVSAALAEAAAERFFPPEDETPRADDARKLERLKGALLANTVWIARDTGFAGKRAHSGFVVDVANRLVIASASAIPPEGAEVALFFAARDKDEVIDRPSHYLDNAPKLGHAGVVLAKDETRGLALIKAVTLPGRATGLPIAKRSAKLGEAVHAMGTTGADAPRAGGTLFQYRSGKAAQVVADAAVGRRAFAGRLLESEPEMHEADSGGPLVNDALEVVGMSVPFRFRTRRSHVSIDCQEIASFLDRVAAAARWKLKRPDPAKGATALAPTVSGYRAALLEAIAKHGIEPAKSVLPGLIETLKDGDAGVRRRALGLIGEARAEALEHVEALFLLCRQAETRPVAEEVLTKLGDEAIPALIGRLNGKKDREVFLSIARVLKDKGPKAKDAEVLLRETAHYYRRDKEAHDLLRNAERAVRPPKKP